VASRKAARPTNAPVALSSVRRRLVISLPVRISFDTVPLIANSVEAAVTIA
jgi:hypothetical protein